MRVERLTRVAVTARSSVLLVLVATCALGESGSPRLRALRLGRDDEVRVDGRLEERFWTRAASSGPLRQVEPVAGARPSEHTEFRVAYDDERLYIGVRCDDSDPDAIVAKEMARDGYLLAEDHVIIVLDTFHDRRNGYELLTNPLGCRADALVSDNTNVNGSWDGVWSVSTRIDGGGWTAEFAVPFSTLGFDPDSGTWGLNVSRNIGRKSEMVRWSGLRPDIRTYNVAETGELLGLEGVEQGVGLDLVSYALLRSRDDRPRSDSDSFSTSAAMGSTASRPT